MYRSFTSYVITVVLVSLVATLSGCSTPTGGTTALDTSYHQKITSLQLLVVHSDFSDVPNLSSEKTFYTLDWCAQVGKLMQQDFNHNGIEVVTSTAVNPKSVAEYMASRPKNVPTLILVPEKVLVHGGAVSLLYFRATLLVPDRTNAVWVGAPTVIVSQTGHQLSLRILNELALKQLITLNRETAETIDGMKHTSFGGVLAP